eukprot:TRINITY_DN51807_c0_g1_i1.p1 TRINITY_DN51807_c0_g1~~TRINITY_DN51807_c0_g1_i1.p1  ORF type:complete len:542 (-),score=13.79 TRINITY_DN51807_c0_g1_i1:93-1499(-)
MASEITTLAVWEGPDGPDEQPNDRRPAMGSSRRLTPVQPVSFPPRRWPVCIDGHPDLEQPPGLDLDVLTTRVAKQFNATADTQELMFEYVRYLELKVLWGDFADNKLAGPGSLQRIWSLHKEDLCSFLQDCRKVQARLCWKMASDCWQSIPAELRKDLVQLTRAERQAQIELASYPYSRIFLALTDCQRACLSRGAGLPNSRLLPALLFAGHEPHPCGPASIDASEKIKAARRASAWREYRVRWGEVPALWRDCMPNGLSQLSICDICKVTSCLCAIMGFAGMGSVLHLSVCRRSLIAIDLACGLAALQTLQPEVFAEHQEQLVDRVHNLVDRVGWWGSRGLLEALLRAGIKPVWPQKLAKNVVSHACPFMMPLLLEDAVPGVREGVFFDAVAAFDLETCRAMISRWPELMLKSDSRYWPRRRAARFAKECGEHGFCATLVHHYTVTVFARGGDLAHIEGDMRTAACI